MARIQRLSDLRRRPDHSRRAVGIIRVSHVGDRKGESFISPGEQRQQIERHCSLQGMELVDIFEELDVSGGTPLRKRRGLKAAVDLIESGDVEVIVAAYFDRLVRDLTVQHELVTRVEIAGGAILAIDAGEISARTASRWLTSTMLGMVAEYHRRITREKIAAAREDSVLRGVPPWAQIIPGYRRGPRGVLEIEPTEAPHVTEAFRLRAHGASLQEVRTYLAEHGIKRSYHATKTLLSSRVVLGEVIFGDLRNLDAHEPIVDRVTWQRCQDVRIPRGRRPKSPRLLARLVLLRCGSCDAAMSAATVKSHGKPYPVYRCAMSTDCPHGPAISCDLLERQVVEKVRARLVEETETASIELKITEAALDLAQREAELDAAVEAFEGLNVSSARRRMLEMQSGIELARRRLEGLRTTAAPTKIVNAARNWPTLTLDEQRGLIRATVERITIWPRGSAERVVIQLFGE